MLNQLSSVNELVQPSDFSDSRRFGPMHLLLGATGKMFDGAIRSQAYDSCIAPIDNQE